MVEDNFSGESEDDLQINCGIISIISVEYDRVSEVSEVEEYFLQDGEGNQKPLCYYIMNNGVVEEQQVLFERPGPCMIYHLKPLFIREKVDNMDVNKVFVDGVVTVI